MSLLMLILEQKHHVYRRTLDWIPAEEFSGLSSQERMTRRFEKLCAAETPVILPEEQVCFLRTAVLKNNDVFSEAEWREIRKTHFIHELGYVSNLSPDYEDVLRTGLFKKRDTADEYGKRAIDALIGLADRYREEALRQGREDIAETLSQVPRYGARSFREALQFFRILHYGLWLENNYHITVGRFDQYMYPYLRADMESGIYTRESALALLEDFFLSFNKDSDLYPGVQQGDNGQSMVLGGCDRAGNDAFNLLSELCLQASENLKLIDPKINLRVGKNTPLRVYELGSRLTKAGLGFPQYSNDDVVIPALVAMGYGPADAADYVVAACWEFIVPKVGADVANIGALSFPKAVDSAMHKSLKDSQTFDAFLDAIRHEIFRQAGVIVENIHDLWFVPSPFMNVMMVGKDISQGGKYNNFGIHGTGIATAADSLAAIKTYVYDRQAVTPARLIQAVDSDFQGENELLARLRYETPKMGQNETLPDKLGTQLLDWFSDALEGRVNCRGGKYRAGTGSAMFYLWHAAEIGASPDGRRKGEPFGTNFSPSLLTKTDGPFSVISSFTKQHLSRAMNGGPLTLEFSSGMFQQDDSIRKIALLVKSFIQRGGHQLQLNAVNLEELKDAQAHPELHRNLVVRIWGWSAYFVELDKEYQDHVMARQEYTV
jgi:pyruvate-formate lyase